MIRSLQLLGLGLLAGLCCWAAGSGALELKGSIDRPAVPNEPAWVGDTFIAVLSHAAGTPAAVDYTRGQSSGVAELDRLAAETGVSQMRPQFPGAAQRAIEPLARHYKIHLREGRLEAAMEAYAGHPLVARVEPIGIHPVLATPNDGFYGDQWHLDQSSDHDMDAPEAWNVETGQPAVVVAMLDTGVRYYHKDLGGVNASASNPGAARGNMWLNDAELGGASGVDDDGNGYVDDWVGYDFVDGASNCWSGEDCSTKDNDPRDFNGHGTHCAGNISAINNNGYATCAPSGGWGNGSLEELGNGVRTMACRVGWSGSYFGQEVGYVRMDFCAEAFYYAADMGARIASCSWGSSNSGGIADAVSYFTGMGGLVYKAAGNDGGQSADYLCGRSDVISVAATDQNDCKASFSTYGTWVDIAAPGVDVMSLYHDHGDPGSDYVATMSGTSMATPLAAATAALVWSQNPTWSASQVEQRIYDTADAIDGLSCNSAYIGKLGAGRVNAFRAVDTGTPPPAADFSASPTTGCAPLAVAFTDLSTGEITGWEWDFGDGGTSTAQNPSYTYTAAGTFTVSLTVTGPGGSDTATKIDYIAVADVPAAEFSGAPTSGPAPLTVEFTDLSTGGPTAWSWDFGNGGTSTAQNPSATYSAAGDYTVSLTVSNACGTDAVTKTGYIHVTEPSPQAYALSDIPVAGSVSGAYTDTHASDGVYEAITEVNSGTHPRKWYSMLEHRWDFQVTAGTAVTFQVEAYRPDNPDGDDFIFEYSAGGSAFLPLVTVNSATEQIYNAELPADLSGAVVIRVVDSDHTRDRQSLDTIYIDSMVIESSSGPVPPTADFTADPTAGTAPLTVQFTDLSTGEPTSWSWSFGDGGTSAAQNPSHEYTAAGTYTVALTASNAYGDDTETKLDYITVTGGETGTLHVHDMVVTRKIAGPNHSGLCTVTVFDGTEAPVSGAAVFATATGPVGGDFSGTTGEDGTVEFETRKTRNPGSDEWCFEVTNVSLSGYVYDAGGNHVTMACESGPVYSEEDGSTVRSAELSPAGEVV
ncbi:MAG: PKD domain-containing protein, partial [Candidatus Eisenbacteria bacterium]|nr:PKD domain-containing protein [Candidatus Eisenbacteria bacterium]